MQGYAEHIFISQYLPHLQNSQTVIFILFFSLRPFKIQIDAIKLILFQYLLYIFGKCSTGRLICNHRFPLSTGSAQTKFCPCSFHIRTDRLYQFLPASHSFPILKNTGILKRKRPVFIGTDVQKNQIITRP